MSEVFLSYKAEDRGRLRPLVTALEADGCRVWWDAHIGAGDDWREEILEHLDGANCVLVAWSEGSVGHDGRFVRDEATRAVRRDTYVAICIDQVEPPLGFGELQAIPLQGWKGNRKDPRYQALLSVLRARLEGEAPPPPIETRRTQSRITRRALVAGGAAATAAVAAAGWLAYGGSNNKGSKRIAVMPFANLSGDPAQAYFSDGIAEELRGALSRIGLEVIGRTSSDAVRELDAKKAAAKLGVSNILTGSVRRSPQTIRISAQLVDGRDGVERWAQSYDRAPGDSIKIQSDIAASVADALSVALGMAARAALTLGGTSDNVAQDLFMKSQALRRQSDNQESLKTALGLLDAAIARDPNYADAYVEKSMNLEILGAQFPASPADGVLKLTQAERAARKAITIAPRLGAGYAMLSTISLVRLNLGQAMAMARRSLAESPSSPRVLKQAAFCFTYVGNTEEALALLAQGLSLDPFDSAFHILRAQANYYSHRYKEAINGAKNALAVAPERKIPQAIIGDCLRELGEFTQARTAYQKLSAADPLRVMGEAILAARTKDRKAATAGIVRLQQLGGDSLSYQIGQVYAQLGATDSAFAALNKAFEVKDPGLLTIKKDPAMDPIRSDPRFIALLKRLNFP